MSLASIQKIVSVEKHPNADLLDICQVLNYKCITKRDQFKVGQLVVFIEPDSVLPDKPWATFYNSKSNRVKAIKLRGEWSFGIIESLELVSEALNGIDFDLNGIEGKDVSELLGVTKYEAPQPQDLSAAGVYGFGIPKTDETRWQSVRDLPFGEVCDVTLKIDGQSFSALYNKTFHPVIAADIPQPNGSFEITKAIGGRSFLFKENVDNNYKKNEKRYDVLNKLEKFCEKNNINLCIRGESYGVGIQKYAHNPHAKLPLNLAFFSVWLIDEKRYATKGHPLYIFELAKVLDLPTVPMLEKDVILTKELIQKYDEGISEIDGKPFEGVVINWKGGSFKVINKKYDSLK